MGIEHSFESQPCKKQKNNHCTNCIFRGFLFFQTLAKVIGIIMIVCHFELEGAIKNVYIPHFRGCYSNEKILPYIPKYWVLRNLSYATDESLLLEICLNII